MAEQESPLIPTSILGLDIPTQRWYALSFGALLQAFKLADLTVPALASVVYTPTTPPVSSTYFLWKWIFLDALYVYCLPRLRLPKLRFAWQASLLQCLVLTCINYVLFGAWINPLQQALLADWMPSIDYKVPLFHSIQGSNHLQGQHIVFFAPLDTVQLNPYGDTFCLSSSTAPALIPVLFNNTVPTSIHIQVLSLNGDIVKSEKRSTKDMPLQKKAITNDDDDDDEEYTPSGDELSPRSLEPTQTLRSLSISVPGKVTITSADKAHIRLGEVTVVECPSASLSDAGTSAVIRCLGEEDQLKIRIKGHPPLSVSYSKVTGDRRERFYVESIVGSTEGSDARYEDTVSLPIKLASSGTHVFTLETVTDALGNTITLQQNTMTLQVLRRASFGFSQCSNGKTVPLLIGNTRGAELSMSSRDFDSRDAPYVINIKRLEDGEIMQLSSVMSPQNATYRTKRPGSYEIVNVSGRHCSGIVMSPASCRVSEQPLPRVNVSWSRIHECTGDTGVTASLILQGKPPFDVYYSTKRDAGPTRLTRESFSGSRGEIVLQPEESGHYQYKFTKISDGYYRDVPIVNAETMDQTVRPLAFAQFRRSGRGMGVNSCSGSFIDVDVELKGTPPWTVEAQVVGPSGSEFISMRDIKRSVGKLNVPIPPEVDRDGGTFQVDLVSVADAQGCKRMLSVPGIQVDVRRIKPTAKFYAEDGHSSVTILEGESASLPLRLTGEGPWTASYTRLHSDKQETLTAKLTSPNGVIQIRDPGIYTLHEVHDKYCQGEILTPAEYTVAWVPRPTIEIVPTEGLHYSQYTGMYVKAAVCQGEKDSVELKLDGTPPFHVSYNLRLDPTEGVASEDPERISFSSIQRTAKFDLETGKPGMAAYTIEQLGDAMYDPNRVSHSSIRLAQEIVERPSARFIEPQALTFCLYDAFMPRTASGNAGIIALKGRPPFYLEFSIQSLATGETRQERVRINEHRWAMAVEDFQFRTVGAYTVTIDAVMDSSKCSEDAASLSSRSIMVHVAETAAIVPFDRRSDYCIGDKMRFQLEGIPPWHVSFKINDRLNKAKVYDPQFERLAEIPGTFSIIGLSHQTAMCQTPITDINYKIHEIPTAKVGQGKPTTNSIIEGEQTEIKFTLEGVPPFTFSYQRSELSSSKRGQKPAVLETHTVSGVMTHEYSVFSSQEGVWTVTFIADKYCKYPQNVESKPTAK